MFKSFLTGSAPLYGGQDEVVVQAKSVIADQ